MSVEDRRWNGMFPLHVHLIVRRGPLLRNCPLPALTTVVRMLGVSHLHRLSGTHLFNTRKKCCPSKFFLLPQKFNTLYSSEFDDHPVNFHKYVLFEILMDAAFPLPAEECNLRLADFRRTNYSEDERLLLSSLMTTQWIHRLLQWELGGWRGGEGREEEGVARTHRGEAVQVRAAASGPQLHSPRCRLPAVQQRRTLCKLQVDVMNTKLYEVKRTANSAGAQKRHRGALWMWRVGCNAAVSWKHSEGQGEHSERLLGKRGRRRVRGWGRGWGRGTNDPQLMSRSQFQSEMMPFGSKRWEGRGYLAHGAATTTRRPPVLCVLRRTSKWSGRWEMSDALSSPPSAQIIQAVSCPMDSFLYITCCPELQLGRCGRHACAHSRHFSQSTSTHFEFFLFPKYRRLLTPEYTSLINHYVCFFRNFK